MCISFFGAFRPFSALPFCAVQSNAPLVVQNVSISYNSASTLPPLPSVACNPTRSCHSKRNGYKFACFFRFTFKSNSLIVGFQFCCTHMWMDTGHVLRLEQWKQHHNSEPVRAVMVCRVMLFELEHMYFLRIIFSKRRREGSRRGGGGRECRHVTYAANICSNNKKYATTSWSGQNVNLNPGKIYL